MPKKSPTHETGAGWSRSEQPILGKLTSPARIQGFLDTTAYSADSFYRSPREVMRDRKAHCFDGALFAAAALRRLGHAPLLLDMRAVNDDDHILALFEVDGHWGAIAKSNFVGLRYREPIFRNLRELVLSYFELYFNSAGEKTLREYSTPLDLRSLDGLGWMHGAAGLETIAARLDSIRHYPILTRRMIDRLNPIDERSLQAGMVGTDAAGLYKPKG
jgi:hypothetical protein